MSKISKDNKTKIAVAAGLLLVIALYFGLCAALKSYSSNLIDYLNKNEINTQLPSGAELGYSSVEKDRGTVHVVCNASAKLDGDSDKWITLSLSKQKADLKAIGDLAIGYIKSLGWDNSYDLYITQGFGADYFVYNYETDVMYYPKNIEILRAMYKAFGTTYGHDLIGDSQGEAFLIKNGLATEKHGEVEMHYTDISYGVYIHNGEFSDFGSSPHYTD